MSRVLKDWLKTYIEYTKYSEAPELFHFWAGVSTIASALRRRVWIDQKYFEWIPNFYIILVAPAGVSTKSTSIGVGKDLLTNVDGVKFGPDSGTWQAVGQALEQAQEIVPIDKDLEGEFEEMACIACTPGELGTFLDFQDRKMVDTLTSLWDGQRVVYEHRTATSSNIYIKNPCINLISGTTPAWLKKNVPEEMIGAGLASRIIFVFADKKRQLVAYPGYVSTPQEHAEVKEKLIHDLQDIGLMVGPMTLTPEAIEWGEDWYERHWGDRPIHMASSRFDGYLARKQTHIHKLAMVLSASQTSDRIINVQHLSAAEKITSGMETDMINVFESIGVAPTTQLLGEVVSFIHTYQKQGHAVTMQSLYRHCFQTMSKQELEDVMETGVRAGYLELKQMGGEVYCKLLVEPEEIGRPRQKEKE